MELTIPPFQAETPAPGAYKPEGVHPQHETKAPQYSMAARTAIRTNDVTPAPTTYNLGTTVGAKTPMVGNAPSHSMAGRTKNGVCVYIYVCMYVYVCVHISLSLTNTHSLTLSFSLTLTPLTLALSQAALLMILHAPLALASIMWLLSLSRLDLLLTRCKAAPTCLLVCVCVCMYVCVCVCVCVVCE